MKRLLLTMTALAAAAGAAPSVAQYYPQADTRYSVPTRTMSSAEFRDRISRLELRLNAGIRSGEISRSEEIALRRQVINLRQLERQYSYNGLSWNERQNLQAQLRTVRQNIA